MARSSDRKDSPPVNQRKVKAVDRKDSPPVNYGKAKVVEGLRVALKLDLHHPEELALLGRMNRELHALAKKSLVLALQKIFRQIDRVEFEGLVVNETNPADIFVKLYDQLREIYNNLRRWRFDKVTMHPAANPADAYKKYFDFFLELDSVREVVWFNTDIHLSFDTIAKLFPHLAFVQSYAGTSTRLQKKLLKIKDLCNVYLIFCHNVYSSLSDRYDINNFLLQIKAKHPKDYHLFREALLTSAVYCGKIKEIKNLIENFFIPDPMPLNNYVLNLALRIGIQSQHGIDAPIILFLLEHGANIAGVEKYGTSVLAEAIRRGQTDVVKLLLTRKANVKLLIDGKQTLLSHAYTYQQLSEIVELLLDHGAETNNFSRSTTALHVAAQLGHEGVVKKLLEKKVEIDPVETLTGCTPLMEALTSEKINKDSLLPILRMLLDAKANPNHQNLDGSTPLLLTPENYKVYELLLEKKADTNLANLSGVTPLMHVVRDCESIYMLLTHRLLESKADVNQCDINDDTALIYACDIDKPYINSVVTLLLEAKASVNHQNARGETALFGAVHTGNVVVMQTLLKAKAVVDHCDKRGNTALIWACARVSHEIEAPIKLLLDAKAEVDHPNANGQTPLMTAAHLGDPVSMKILLAAGANPLLMNNLNQTLFMIIDKMNREESIYWKNNPGFIDRLKKALNDYYEAYAENTASAIRNVDTLFVVENPLPKTGPVSIPRQPELSIIVVDHKHAAPMPMQSHVQDQGLDHKLTAHMPMPAPAQHQTQDNNLSNYNRPIPPENPARLFYHGSGAPVSSARGPIVDTEKEDPASDPTKAPPSPH